jgi:2'-5' RNA ligase
MKHTPKTIRSFVAIELSEEARTELARLQSRLEEASSPKTVRWTDPKNLHLTLHFLGDVTEDHLENVGRAIRDEAAAHAPFSLDISNLGCFPNARRPRIVWVGLTGHTDQLITLQSHLGVRLKKEIGFEPDSRTYSPHLTIGRVKKGVTQSRLGALGEILEKQIPRVGRLATLPVNQIHYIRSDLKPDGPIYTSLAKARLGQDYQAQTQRI